MRRVYFFGLILAAYCSSAMTPPHRSMVGIASWYSENSPGVRRTTANGERFDDSKLTCASWHHKMGTYLKVVNLDNGRSVVCRVNDRGPAKRLKRLVDLSKASFERIERLNEGLARVAVMPVG